MSEGLLVLQLDPLEHHFDPEDQAPTLWGVCYQEMKEGGGALFATSHRVLTCVTARRPYSNSASHDSDSTCGDVGNRHPSGSAPIDPQGQRVLEKSARRPLDRTGRPRLTF